MNFNSAYQIIGTVPEILLENINEQIKLKVNHYDYNYKDRNILTGDLSWLRLDFMSMPNDTDKVELYNTILCLVNFIQTSYKIDPLSSVSVSMLQPRQILDEHTDGRFLHRITNRYLVPLMDSEVNYNYGYYNGVKTIYPLKYGNIYRINNAIIHSAVNNEDSERFNILIDTMDGRLKEKFDNHPDKWESLALLGVNYEFEKRLKVNKK